MNGKRTFGKTIPDKQLSEIMNEVFNGWFKRWKKVELNDDKFNQAFDEIWEIMRVNDEYPVVAHLCISLLYELDARLHGGYTETTRDKLLTLIKGEHL